MPTVHDVARRAGVSIATVSRVFGRPEAVAAPTRERVREAAHALGYSPNTTARALQRGRTGYLGLLVHDLANPFYATVAKAAQLEARRHGLALFCADYGDRPDEELDLAREMARHVDGLLLYPSRPPEELEVADLGPLVVLDSPVADTPTVLDVHRGRGRPGRRPSRGAGPQRPHLRRRRPTDDVHEPRPARQRRGRVRPHRGRTGRRRPVLPDLRVGVRAADLAVARGSTAVLAFSDQMALGVVRRLTERGVRVGGDVSVVGVDDIWIAAQVTPALTTVRMPCAEAGRPPHASWWHASRRRRVPTVVLPTELIVRSSTGPAPEKRTT